MGHPELETWRAAEIGLPIEEHIVNVVEDLKTVQSVLGP